MPDIVRDAVMIASVIVISMIFTILFSKWIRSRPKEEREAFEKSMKPIVKIDQLIWRFVFWPILAVISVTLIYLYFTDQL